jgi:hypothetical protein
MTIKVVELVSDTVIEEFNNVNHAYEKRDELQEAALKAGYLYNEKRYGIRQSN